MPHNTVPSTAHGANDVATLPASSKQFLKRLPHAVLFGDSLTERAHVGWASHLSEVYSRKLDIVVRGFGGYNTRDAVEALPFVLAPYRESGAPELALFTIFLGANDSAQPVELKGTPHSARQHVPIEEYERNLAAIVAGVRAVAPRVRILFITPPPVHEPSRHARLVERIGQPAADALPAGTLDRRNAFTKQYADACRALGTALKIPVVELWTRLQHDENENPVDAESWGPKYLDDGLHLTAAGQERVARLVEHAIRMEFPELHPSGMLNLMPHWEDVTGLEGWGRGSDE